MASSPEDAAAAAVPTWYVEGITACCLARQDIPALIAPGAPAAALHAMEASWDVGQQELQAFLCQAEVPQQLLMCLPAAGLAVDPGEPVLPAACRPSVQGGKATLRPPGMRAEPAAAGKASPAKKAQQRKEAALRAELMVVRELQQQLLQTVGEMETIALTLDGFEVPDSVSMPPSAVPTATGEQKPRRMQRPPPTSTWTPSRGGRKQRGAGKGSKNGSKRRSGSRSSATASPRQRQAHATGKRHPPRPAMQMRGGAHSTLLLGMPMAGAPAHDALAAWTQLQGGGLWSGIKAAAGAVKRTVLRPVVKRAAKAFRWARKHLFSLTGWILRHPSLVTALTYLVRVFFLALCAAWSSEEFVRGYRVVPHPLFEGFSFMPVKDLVVGAAPGDEADDIRAIFKFVMHYFREGFKTTWDFLSGMVNGVLGLVLAPLENTVPMLGALVHAVRNMLNESLYVKTEQTLELLMLVQGSGLLGTSSRRETNQTMAAHSLLRTIRLLLGGCRGAGFELPAEGAATPTQDAPAAAGSSDGGPRASSAAGDTSPRAPPPPQPSQPSQPSQPAAGAKEYDPSTYDPDDPDTWHPQARREYEEHQARLASPEFLNLMELKTRARRAAEEAAQVPDEPVLIHLESRPSQPMVYTAPEEVAAAKAAEWEAKFPDVKFPEDMRRDIIEFETEQQQKWADRDARYEVWLERKNAQETARVKAAHAEHKKRLAREAAEAAAAYERAKEEYQRKTGHEYTD